MQVHDSHSGRRWHFKNEAGSLEKLILLFKLLEGMPGDWSNTTDRRWIVARVRPRIVFKTGGSLILSGNHCQLIAQQDEKQAARHR